MFLFRLALQMGATVAELSDRLSAAELAEWMAFDSIEPFGDQRADIRAGVIASTVCNFSMSPPRKPATPADFCLFHRKQQSEEPIKPRDEQHHKQLVHALFGRINAQVRGTDGTGP